MWTRPSRHHCYHSSHTITHYACNETLIAMLEMRGMNHGGWWSTAAYFLYSQFSSLVMFGVLMCNNNKHFKHVCVIITKCGIEISAGRLWSEQIVVINQASWRAWSECDGVMAGIACTELGICSSKQHSQHGSQHQHGVGNMVTIILISSAPAPWHISSILQHEERGGTETWLWWWRCSYNMIMTIDMAGQR